MYSNYFLTDLLNISSSQFSHLKIGNNNNIESFGEMVGWLNRSGKNVSIGDTLPCFRICSLYRYWPMCFGWTLFLIASQ